jgi:hypothetical protein
MKALVVVVVVMAIWPTPKFAFERAGQGRSMDGAVAQLADGRRVEVGE